MKIQTKSAHQELFQYINDAKSKGDDKSLFCIFSFLDEKYHKDEDLHKKFVALLNASDLSDRDFSLFWTTSGHIFVFSEENILPISKTLHNTLKMITGENQKDFLPPLSINLKTEWPLFEDIIQNHGNKDAIEKIVQKTVRSRKKDVIEDLSEHIEKSNVKLEGNIDLRGSRRLRHKPYLLSVEDDMITQEIISAMMAPYCHILKAKTVKEALSAYEENLPNIVFMDIELPDGNGEDLTRALCKQDSEAFIVMVSGHISQERIDRCVEIGAHGFIAKPVNSQFERMLYFIHLYNSMHRPGNIKKKA
ncbi:MAG: response regulator [Alphaproteobacteria bacterium]|nr:response regulator [Alphaproteobacteria bacterium]